MLPDVVESLLARGLARRSEGAVAIFFGENEPPALIQKTDGAFTYTTTDLATIRYRLEQWRPDAILYVVDSRQALHFKNLFDAVRRWGLCPKKGTGSESSRCLSPFSDRLLSTGSESSRCLSPFSDRLLSTGSESSRCLSPFSDRLLSTGSESSRCLSPFSDRLLSKGADPFFGQVALEHISFGSVLGPDRKPIKTARRRCGGTECAAR